ncbi:glyoxalase [Cryptosporangium arvum]|nr:glyoxalase [Cryptosporangium arvum]
MTTIKSLVIEAADPTTATAFYQAIGLADRVRIRHDTTPTTGFRGCTVSLVVSQPATVDALTEAAMSAGATALKPVTKSFWGYGGVVRAPDGTIVKIASSSKKNTGPATKHIDDVVLLLGAENVATTKKFYLDRGLTVKRGFGNKYVEFESSGVKFALYGRRALAKDAGVPTTGSGSHRLAIAADEGDFSDPDGFAWESR